MIHELAACRRAGVRAWRVELTTQVEQLAVVDGVKLESVANILVGEHVARLPFARARGRLYVLVEPIGDRSGWGGISREIAQAVHDEYYEGGGSVTAGLRLALERANTLLCEMNAAESGVRRAWRAECRSAQGQRCIYRADRPGAGLCRPQGRHVAVP